MSNIKMSQEYLGTLNNMLKVVADLPNKSHALLFKNEDAIVHSAMALNTLVSTRASKDHVEIEEPEIRITNLTEFVNYAKAIGYPAKDSEISVLEETTTKGKTVKCFKFEGNHSVYRMPVGSPTAFSEQGGHFKIPVAKEKDPMELVAKFYLDIDDIKRLVKDIQLMGNKLDFFGLHVNNGRVSLYMKNVQNQQVTKKIEGNKVQVFNGYAMEQPKPFNNKIFSYMSYFNCDFEVEIRVIKRSNGELMAIKAHSVPYTTPVKKKKNAPDINKIDPIDVYIGTQESSAHACSINMFDIVE